MTKIKLPDDQKATAYYKKRHSSKDNKTNSMDKVKIKRVKRDKKKVTAKEKVLAGLGVGGSLLGGAANISRIPPSQSTATVSTLGNEQKSITSKIKNALSKIFTGAEQATFKAKTAKAYDSGDSFSDPNNPNSLGMDQGGGYGDWQAVDNDPTQYQTPQSEDPQQPTTDEPVTIEDGGDTEEEEQASEQAAEQEEQEQAAKAAQEAEQAAQQQAAAQAQQEQQQAVPPAAPAVPFIEDTPPPATLPAYTPPVFTAPATPPPAPTTTPPLEVGIAFADASTPSGDSILSNNPSSPTNFSAQQQAAQDPVQDYIAYLMRTGYTSVVPNTVKGGWDETKDGNVTNVSDEQFMAAVQSFVGSQPQSTAPISAGSQEEAAAMRRYIEGLPGITPSVAPASIADLPVTPLPQIIPDFGMPDDVPSIQTDDNGIHVSYIVDPSTPQGQFPASALSVTQTPDVSDEREDEWDNLNTESPQLPNGETLTQVSGSLWQDNNGDFYQVDPNTNKPVAKPVAVLGPTSDLAPSNTVISVKVGDTYYSVTDDGAVVPAGSGAYNTIADDGAVVPAGSGATTAPSAAVISAVTNFLNSNPQAVPDNKNLVTSINNWYSQSQSAPAVSVSTALPTITVGGMMLGGVQSDANGNPIDDNGNPIKATTVTVGGMLGGGTYTIDPATGNPILPGGGAGVTSIDNGVAASPSSGQTGLAGSSTGSDLPIPNTVRPVDAGGPTDTSSVPAPAAATPPQASPVAAAPVTTVTPAPVWGPTPLPPETSAATSASPFNTTNTPPAVAVSDNTTRVDNTTMGDINLNGETVAVTVVNNGDGTYKIFDSNDKDITNTIVNVDKVAEAVIGDQTPDAVAVNSTPAAPVQNTSAAPTYKGFSPTVVSTDGLVTNTSQQQLDAYIASQQANGVTISKNSDGSYTSYQATSDGQDIVNTISADDMSKMVQQDILNNLPVADVLDKAVVSLPLDLKTSGVIGGIGKDAVALEAGATKGLINAGVAVKNTFTNLEHKAGINVNPNAFDGTKTGITDPTQGPAVRLNDSDTPGAGTPLYKLSNDTYVDDSGYVYKQPNASQNSYVYTGLMMDSLGNLYNANDISNSQKQTTMTGPGGMALKSLGNGIFANPQTGDLYDYDQDGNKQAIGVKMDSYGNLNSTPLVNGSDDTTTSKSKIIGKDVATGVAGSAAGGVPGIVLGGAFGLGKALFQKQDTSIYNWATNPANYSIPGEITYTDRNGQQATLDKFTVQKMVMGVTPKSAKAAINNVIKGN